MIILKQRILLRIFASMSIKDGFLYGSVVKNLPANEGDVSLTSGLGTSPGEGNDNQIQFSCLGNPMDRGAWSHKSWGYKSLTRLRDYKTLSGL